MLPCFLLGRAFWVLLLDTVEWDIGRGLYWKGAEHEPSKCVSHHNFSSSDRVLMEKIGSIINAVY